MPLSDKEIRDLRPTSKRQRVSCGDSLLVVVESVGRGGGKSFVGTTRFPPGRSGKQVDVRIGVYGKGAGKWTLKAAREEWERIRDWSRETGRHPKEAKAGDDQGPSKTLQDAIDGFLDSKRSLKEFTLTNYRRQLQNQVTDVIPAMTPLRELEWERVRRAKKANTTTSTTHISSGIRRLISTYGIKANHSSVQRGSLQKTTI